MFQRVKLLLLVLVGHAACDTNYLVIVGIVNLVSGSYLYLMRCITICINFALFFNMSEVICADIYLACLSEHSDIRKNSANF